MTTATRHVRLGNGSTALTALWLSASVLAVPVSARQAALAVAEEQTVAPTDTLGRAGEYVEEVIVTAERLKKGAISTQTIIVQTYNVLRRGKRLYNARRYAEALPYLVIIAGKRGFKWAQAMAGDIYLHGRGGVPRDIASGMGWLGVAARPQTAPAIQCYFQQAMAEMPPDTRVHIEDVVQRHRERWSSRDWRVSCRRTVTDPPLGMGVMSLRLGKRLPCTFMDEVPVCRELMNRDMNPLDPVRPPFDWVCPPVTG